MAVGLNLVGHLAPHPDRLSRTAARDWLAKAAVWFEASGDAVLDTRIVRDADEKPVLLAAFHPAGEPVELRLGSNGTLRLNASTSPVGPGFHAHLCGLVKDFAADFEFTWDDPAPDHDPGRYFVVGDRTKLETHFLRWLAMRAAAAVRDGGTVDLGMPRQPHYSHPGPVRTPLGPRSYEWLKAVASDSSAGKDFFPWWNSDADAAFYRGRALAELWLEFRFRPPLTDAEGEQVDQVAADLANAYDLDPAIDLPWAAWKDVIAAIDGDTHQLTVEPVGDALRATVFEKAAADSSPHVGYRRGPVRVHLPGHWSLQVPGSFATQFDEGKAWTAWEAGRSVWFQNTPLGADGPTPGEAVAAAGPGLPPGEPVPPPRGVSGVAVFGPFTEDGKPGWRLTGIAAADGGLAGCNVYVRSPDEREWAVRTWNTLKVDRANGDRNS